MSEYVAECHLCGSGWELAVGEREPEPYPSFCPQCQADARIAPGVLNWRALACADGCGASAAVSGAAEGWEMSDRCKMVELCDRPLLMREIERLRAALQGAKVALMNRHVLGNAIIPEYEALAAAAETEVRRALEGEVQEKG
jgi:hypothetical protein